VCAGNAAAAAAPATSAAAAQRQPPLPPAAGAAGGGGDVHWGSEVQHEGVNGAELLLSSLLMVWLTAGWCVQMAVEQLLPELLLQQLGMLLVPAGKPTALDGGVTVFASCSSFKMEGGLSIGVVGSHSAASLSLGSSCMLARACVIVPQPVVMDTQPAALVHVQALTAAAAAVTAAVCGVWLSLQVLLAVLQVRHGSDCRVTACRLCATDSWQAACFLWPSSAFASCHQLSTKQESAAAHNSCSSPSVVPALLQQPGQLKVDAPGHVCPCVLCCLQVSCRKV
jgi:hypothetical protein